MLLLAHPDDMLCNLTSGDYIAGKTLLKLHHLCHSQKAEYGVQGSCSRCVFAQQHILTICKAT